MISYLCRWHLNKFFFRSLYIALTLRSILTSCISMKQQNKNSSLFSSSWLSKHSWIIQATNVSKTSKPRYDTQQPWLLGHQLPSIHCLIQSPQLQSWYVHTALLEEVCRCDSWMTSNLTTKWTLEHSAIKRNKKKTFF